MGIRVNAGRDAKVNAGRDINVADGVDDSVLEDIHEILDRVVGTPAEAKTVEQIKQELDDMAGAEDKLTRESAMDRIMDLATSLGPAVIAALAQLLPKL